ncbi:MAG: hypothetical protein GY720_03300 [bacterium]|nr:hypothetical protein [bacterium]
MSNTDKELPQEYEEIPWSHLIPVQKDRSLQLALLVVVIAAALLAIMFLVRRSPGAPVAVPAEQPAVSESVVVATTLATAGPVEPEMTMAPVVAAPQIYSEADLMAALPPPGSDMEAVARAEWFVTDYFTVDGDPSLSDGIAAALPDAVSLPQSDGSVISYVEWARAVGVATNPDGEFTVTVWFRTLAGNSESGFDRGPVRAVDVRLVTDAMGRLAIADLPVAGKVASVGIAPQWPLAAEAPPDIVVAAANDAAHLGSDPQLQSAGADDEGWRLVFSVGDASGLRFPIVVRVTGG